jgi:hypothetical protein
MIEKVHVLRPKLKVNYVTEVASETAEEFGRVAAELE